jgi:hypothetical protein
MVRDHFVLVFAGRQKMGWWLRLKLIFHVPWVLKYDSSYSSLLANHLNVHVPKLVQEDSILVFQRYGSIHHFGSGFWSSCVAGQLSHLQGVEKVAILVGVVERESLGLKWGVVLLDVKD